MQVNTFLHVMICPLLCHRSYVLKIIISLCLRNQQMCCHISCIFIMKMTNCSHFIGPEVDSYQHFSQPSKQVIVRLVTIEKPSKTTFLCDSFTLRKKCCNNVNPPASSKLLSFLDRLVVEIQPQIDFIEKQLFQCRFSTGIRLMANLTLIQ